MENQTLLYIALVLICATGYILSLRSNKTK
jgi:hypothetical protein